MFLEQRPCDVSHSGYRSVAHESARAPLPLTARAPAAPTTWRHALPTGRIPKGRRVGPSGRLLPPVEHVVMRGPPVEVCQYGLGGSRDMGDLVVISHERPHTVQRVEPHQGHELDVVRSLAAHEVDRPEPRNTSLLDSGDDLSPDDALIGVCVLLPCPPAPDSTDHETSLEVKLG